MATPAIKTDSESPGQTAAAICETLARALEERNAELAASLYADDAEFIVINRNFPPSNPLVCKGLAAILEFYDDIFSREMSHKMTRKVIGENSIAMSEACLYPDGCRVVSHGMADLQDSKIRRQVNVDCWDE
jgi:ketosteroid isomerase-like protein